MLTQELIWSILDYDSATGELRWKISRGRARAGSVAGWNGGKGHRYIKIGEVETTVARVVWLYVNGVFPETHLWHINGNNSDCRIENLRLQQQDGEPLTQKKLKRLLRYDPNSGIFMWRKASSKKMSGLEAGFLNDQGYLLIGFGEEKYRAHRLAWLYVYGKWPGKDIDHINGIKTDNRITNLREATDSENLANSRKPITNKSGYKGVSWHAEGKKWQAHIRANGRSVYLGLFTDPEEAHLAYCAAAKKYKGKFARFD